MDKASSAADGLSKAPEVSENSSDCLQITKPKYDWYQSETQVVVTMLVKDVRPELLHHDVSSRSLNVAGSRSNGEKFCLILQLAHEIDPEGSDIKIFSTKVEIKLKKVEGIRWDKLELVGVKNATEDAKSHEGVTSNPKLSGQHKKDWDKLVNQVKEEESTEELEGDAAINKLFQKIYSDGSDDVKKAMMKSYSESGGTVLSTDWSDIRRKKIDVQPPAGMEFKKWSG